MMEPRLLAKTLGALAAAYIVTPPSRNATIIHEAFRGYDNMLRAAMGLESTPRPAARPAWTLAGARQVLYDEHRQRWIETGDLDALDLMLRHVR